MYNHVEAFQLGWHSTSVRRSSRWGAAVSSVMLCSCAGTGGLATSTAPMPAGEDGVVRVSAPAAIESRPAQSIVLASAESSVRNADATFTPAERRYPASMIDHQAAACPPGCPPYAAGAGSGMAGDLLGTATPRPDEFLCDGGDANLPVHYDRTFRYGLEPEDTVGEWSDPAGGHHVTPSNKVCVYAPRFGEVRTINAPVGETKVDRLISANEVRHGAGLDARTYLDTEVQKTKLDATRVRSRASGLETDNAVSGFEQATGIALNLKDTPPFVDSAFLHRGELTRGQEAFLAKQIQAAVVWTRTEYPIIAATDVSAQEVHAEFRPSEIVGLEDMNKPGHLRIVKLADKAAAAQGEVITFTIRYDNLGDKPVHHVRIIDNLTPRLELVEGSGTSDRAGRLDVEPNGEGSFVLTFIVDDPLPGKTGGTVTFKARVK